MQHSYMKPLPAQIIDKFLSLYMLRYTHDRLKIFLSRAEDEPLVHRWLSPLHLPGRRNHPASGNEFSGLVSNRPLCLVWSLTAV